MKRIMMLLVAGLMAFGAAEQASASTFNLGTLDPGTTTAVVANLGIPAPASFSDTINFSLASVQSSLIGTLTPRTAIPGRSSSNSMSCCAVRAPHGRS